MANAYEVRAHWDPETRRWWADSDDIPGLVTEGETFDALVERVFAVAPDLIAENLGITSQESLPVHITAERTETVHVGL